MRRCSCLNNLTSYNKFRSKTDLSINISVAHTRLPRAYDLFQTCLIEVVWPMPNLSNIYDKAFL